MKTLAKLQTENRALFEELRKAEERAIAGQFALEIMHEIRNPLEALTNLTYLVSLEADDAEKIRKYMRVAEEQIEHATRIASKTLGFVRSSRSPQKADVVGVAEAALRIHLAALERKRVRLVKSLPEELACEVYVGEMLQAISNLLSNAIEAMPEGGSLHLRLKRRKGSVQILVADNGYGIEKEHLKEIFQPFFTTKGTGGTGLGLAIVKSVVDKHGGTVRVKSSVREGARGTTFRISIPA